MTASRFNCKNTFQRFLFITCLSVTYAHGANLLQNQSFETGDLSNWTNTCNSSFGNCVASEFSHSVAAGKNNTSFIYKSELTNSTDGMNGYTNNIHQAVDTVVGNEQYVISFDAISIDTNIPAGITLWFYEDNGSSGYQFISSASTSLDLIETDTKEWNNYRAVFTTPPTAIRVRVLMHHYAFGQGSFNGEVYWDNFLFESCSDFNNNTYNLVTEGDFENGNSGNEWIDKDCGAGCQVVGDALTPNGYCGDKSFSINLASSGEVTNWNSMTQVVTGISPEERYTLSFSAISNNTDHNSGMTTVAYGATGYIPGSDVKFEPVEANSGQWQDYSIEMITPAGTDRLRLWLRSTKGATATYQGDVQWDNIQLIAHPRIDSIQPNVSDTTINGEFFGATDQDSIIFLNHQRLGAGAYTWTDSEIIVNSLLSNSDSINIVRSGYASVTKSIQDTYYLNGSDINALSIDFDIRRGFAIKSLVTPATGQEYILSDLDLLNSLYELDIKKSPFTDEFETLTTRDMDDYVISQNNETGVKTLTITTYHNNENIIVSSIITLTADGARFEIDVQNNGPLVIQSVRYPIIITKPGIGTDSSKDEVLIPFFEGYLLKDPTNYIFDAGKTDLVKYQNRDRPGVMSSQVLAFYNRELPNDGLFMQSTEHLGYKQKFGVLLDTTSTGQRFLKFAFRHVSAESAGNDITVMEDRLDGLRDYRDYAIIIDDLQAQDSELNWYDAADRYKLWAEQQIWAVPVTQRTDIPDWIFDAKTLLNVYRIRNDCFTQWSGFWRNRLELAESDLMLFNPGGYWGVRSNDPNTDYSSTCNNGYVLHGDNSWSGIDYFVDSGPDPLAIAIGDLAAGNNMIKLMIEGLRWDIYDFIQANDGNPVDKSFCEVPFYSLTDSTINNITLPGDTAGLWSDGTFTDIAVPLDDRNYFDQNGRQFISKEQNGAGLFRINTGIASHRNATGTLPRSQNCRYSAFMCMGNDSSNPLDEMIIDNIAKGINRGARMFSLDGWIGADIEGCWHDRSTDPTHPIHDIGEGRWTHLRYLDFLQSVENKAIELGVANDIVMSTENQAELYMHLAELQHSRHDDLSQAKASKKVALYSYIYKKYFLGFDRGPTMPDDWDDDEGGGANPLDPDKQLYNRWGIGMNFVNANIFGIMSSSHWGRLSKVVNNEYVYFQDKYFGLYKRAVHSHRADIRRGEILRPDIFQWIGNQPAELSVTVSGRDFYIDTILSNAVKIDNTQLSYLFINTNLDEQVAGGNTFNLDLSFLNTTNLLSKSVGIPGDYFKVTITRRGADLNDINLPEVTQFIISNGSTPSTLILKGGDVVEIYIEAITDFDNDGIDNTLDDDDDNDGVLDLNETNTGIFINASDTGTNPLNPDSDSDGVNDGIEIEAGTDPNNNSDYPALYNGDVNNDNQVDAADLIVALQILTGQIAPTELQMARFDVAPLVGGSPNPDGQLTVGDYIVLVRKVLGQITF